MCTAVYARYARCPHTCFHEWIYCTLSPSRVPAAGKACRRYRHKTRKCVSGRATECAGCAMDRKIAEDFGEAALGGLQRGKSVKKRRFWVRGDGDEVPKFERVNDTVVDREYRLVTGKRPVVSLGKEGNLSAQKRGRKRRHDSVLSQSSDAVHNEEDDGVKDGGVMGWIRASFGKK